MTVILAIDPGSEQSAFLKLVGARPAAFGIRANDEMLAMLRLGIPGGEPVDVVVIEQMQYYGMAVGREVFDTVHWAGRFTEAAHPLPVEQLSRKAVAAAVCNDARAKDANVRLALIDRFGGTPAIRKGGPLYGISKDVWAALGVAVTHADQIGGPA